MRTSEQIRAEIVQTFGFLPPFFEPALGSPQVLENLWQQTLSAYTLNPLSALFKEKLNALLSRFCAAPYCMIVHSSALRPLGMTGLQVLALLDAPPLDEGMVLPLGALPVPIPEEAAAPAPDSPLERALLFCATAVFLERDDAPTCQAELRRLLGPDLYPHLVAYLAYIKTCHTWIEAHPEVTHEADRRSIENLGPLLAEEPALDDFFRHYQERVEAQRLGGEGRKIADEKLRAEQARTAVFLESITDAFATFDSEWRFTYVNDNAARLLARGREELLGRSVWDEFPETVGTVSDREYHRAVDEQVTVSFEQFYPSLGVWFQVRAYPSADGLSVFFQDITQEAENRRRERFLAGLAERARVLTDPDEVITDAVRSLGEFLGVGRCVFGDIDLLADTCTIVADHCADETVASIVGVFPFSAFGPFVVAEYRAGRAVTVDDVRLDPVRVTEANVAPYEAMGIRAHITAPVVHSARLVSVVAVHNLVPRHWTPDDVELIQAVVGRTWLTVEVLRQQRALAREAEERERLAAQQRTFLRDVLLSVTEGHLLLCAEPEDLPVPPSPFGGPVSLSRESGLRELRHMALDAAGDMAADRKHDLVTAVSEAAMNAVVHGGGDERGRSRRRRDRAGVDRAGRGRSGSGGGPRRGHLGGEPAGCHPVAGLQHEGVFGTRAEDDAGDDGPCLPADRPEGNHSRSGAEAHKADSHLAVTALLWRRHGRCGHDWWYNGIQGNLGVKHAAISTDEP